MTIISASWMPTEPMFPASALNDDALGKFSRELFKREYRELTDREACRVWDAIEAHSK